MSRPMIRRLSLLGLLAASGATLIGGGDDAPAGAARDDGATEATATQTAAAGAQAPDPCTLVTAADLEAAFGSPFEDGAAEDTTPPITFHSCGFIGSADDLVARTVVIQTLGDADIAEAMDRTAVELYEETRDLTDDAEPVDGLGDDAYSAAGSINFVQDGVYVTIAAPGAASAEATAGLSTIATAVSSAL